MRYLYSYRGDIEIFQILLKYGADVNIKYGSEGNDILHQAVSQGLVNHVKLLLKKGCNIHTKNNNGETLLHFAAEVHCYFDKYTHHDDLVKHLLNHGIDPNHKNNEGKIVLDILLERFKHFCACYHWQ